MTNIEYYYELTKRSINSEEEYLKIKSFCDIDDILPLLKGDYGAINYSRLNAIVFQRYYAANSDSTIYDIKLKDDILDLSQFTNLNRLDVWGSMKVKKIIFPKIPCLKMLNILRIPNLESF